MTYSVGNIRRVRQSLQEELSPVMARAILFDALTRWGPQIPQDRDELTRFVRGALRDVLTRYLRAEDVGVTMLRIEMALAVVDHADDPSRVHVPSQRPPPMMDPGLSADTTRALKPIERPVEVLVVSMRPSFSSTIELALGGSLVHTAPAPSILALRAELERDIDIILMDAGDPPPVEPTRLASILNRIGPDTWIAVWGSKLVFGSDLIRTLEAGGVPCIAFAIPEGMAPFVDLVRSRQAE
jgi:hypothetical protein